MLTSSIWPLFAAHCSFARMSGCRCVMTSIIRPGISKVARQSGCARYRSRIGWKETRMIQSASTSSVQPSHSVWPLPVMSLHIEMVSSCHSPMRPPGTYCMFQWNIVRPNFVVPSSIDGQVSYVPQVKTSGAASGAVSATVSVEMVSGVIASMPASGSVRSAGAVSSTASGVTVSWAVSDGRASGTSSTLLPSPHPGSPAARMKAAVIIQGFSLDIVGHLGKNKAGL